MIVCQVLTLGGTDDLGPRDFDTKGSSGLDKELQIGRKTVLQPFYSHLAHASLHFVD